MFQTLGEIAEKYHISTKRAGKILYELGIRDEKHPVKKGFPYEQYVTHGIAQPVTDGSGRVAYYRYNLEPIKEEFEAKLADSIESPVKKNLSRSAASDIAGTLSRMVTTLNEAVKTRDVQLLYRLKADIADIYAQLPEATARPKQELIELDEEARERFECLRQWRNATAKERGVPPYTVLTNAVLNAIAYYRPEEKEELLSIKGFGERKAALYADEILKLL